jgi:hypothetical protein
MMRNAQRKGIDETFRNARLYGNFYSSRIDSGIARVCRALSFPNSEGRSSLQKADLGEGPRIKTDAVACKDSDNWLSYSELATILDGKRLSCRGPQNGELRTLVNMPDALAALPRWTIPATPFIPTAQAQKIGFGHPRRHNLYLPSGRYEQRPL